MLFSAVGFFMRRDLNRIQSYFRQLFPPTHRKNFAVIFERQLERSRSCAENLCSYDERFQLGMP